MAGLPKVLPSPPRERGAAKKPPELAPEGLSSALSAAPWVELRKLGWKPGFQVSLPDGANFAVGVDGLRVLLERLGAPNPSSLLDYAWSFAEVVLNMKEFTIHRVFMRNRRIREDRIVSERIGAVN